MSLTTNPRNPDTDGDGYGDGDEFHLLAVQMLITASLLGAILHSRDYDTDGLPDGFEYAMWEYARDYDIDDRLNVTNASDAETSIVTSILVRGVGFEPTNR